jgi:hypothetical protein
VGKAAKDAASWQKFTREVWTQQAVGKACTEAGVQLTADRKKEQTRNRWRKAISAIRKSHIVVEFGGV